MLVFSYVYIHKPLSVKTVTTYTYAHVHIHTPTRRCGTIPPRAIANNLWIGDPSSTMRNLSLPERVLTCPTRTKVYVHKLTTFGGNDTAQRGCKHNVISFPQTNAVGGHLPAASSTLPRSTSDLVDFLSVIFVGSTLPTDAQLRKVFKVDASNIRTCLDEWRRNGHPGYDGDTWNEKSMEEMRHHKTCMDALKACISRTSRKNDAASQRNSTSLSDGAPDDTTPTDEVDVDDDDDGTFDGDIVTEISGMVNVNGDSEDTTPAVKRAVDAILVDHGKEPVNTWSNPGYWVNTFPALFPYGCGGAEEDDRPTKLSIKEWIRHMLQYHDGRFRRDATFPFVCFAIIQTRERVTLSHVLYSKCFRDKQTQQINASTSSDFKESLEYLRENKTLFGGPQPAKNVSDLIKNLKVVGSKMTGSVFERNACRSEIIAMVTSHGLPNVFITLNPSDIHNPTVSFWNANMQGKDMQFNLDTLLGDFPDTQARARLVAEDPVLCADFFNTVITAFLESFLGFEKPKAVGGPRRQQSCLPKGKLLNETIFTGEGSRGLKGFYGTVECQGRGSLHLHMLIWLAGFPRHEGTKLTHILTLFLMHYVHYQLGHHDMFHPRYRSDLLSDLAQRIKEACDKASASTQDTPAFDTEDDSATIASDTDSVTGADKSQNSTDDESDNDIEQTQPDTLQSLLRRVDEDEVRALDYTHMQRLDELDDPSESESDPGRCCESDDDHAGGPSIASCPFVDSEAELSGDDDDFQFDDGGCSSEDPLGSVTDPYASASDGGSLQVPGPVHLQDGWMKDVSRYLETIIKENRPRSLPGSAPGDDKVPNTPRVLPTDKLFRSRRPEYYTSNPDAMTVEQQREAVVARTLDELHLASTVQNHNCNACCVKYGTKSCRFKFPRPIVLTTFFKDGAVISKRLDSTCNNYNKAILSVMRSNQDIKLLSTGVDSKATIFYITDYVTKSEMSQIQTVTLLKVAVDKIAERNAAHGTKKLLQSLNVDENRARERIYTCLNTMEADVERSAQWVSLVLLGLPLEYKSHTFRSLSASTFSLSL